MKITYFAWIRDEVGIDEEEITLPAEVTNVGMLIDWLASREQQNDRAFDFVEVVKVVVNRKYVHNDHPVKNDDEVFFFPPIAGG